MEPEFGSLEYYMTPTPGTWREKLLPHEVVAWRKLRKGRWIAWSGYSRYYSWNNIKKWVQRRGDVYQVAMMNGQIVTVRRNERAEAERWAQQMAEAYR